MEHMHMGAAICEGDWSSLSGMYYSNEEADLMVQLLGNFPVANELGGSTSLGNQSAFWPSHGSANMAGFHQNSYFSFEFGNSSYSGGGGSIIFPSSSQESYYLSDSNPIFASNHSPISMEFCLGDVGNMNTSSYLIEGDDDDFSKEMSDANAEDLSVKNIRPKMESEMQPPEPVTVEKFIINPSENSKKRSRNTADVKKNKSNVRSKKKQKVVSTSNNVEEDSNIVMNGGHNTPSSSSCCSDQDDDDDEEDDSNASQEPNGRETSSMSCKGKIALNLNGKTRASRGSATDPQSLHARKRRERINERLRILQNLVPNGTKVDISTMLEEAVQYVKFLQVQIKLLGSDELWMYAPIAYNGMNL